MASSRSNPSKLAHTLISLSTSSPQVIASRTWRFMQPGVLTTASGQAEFLRMFTEKQAAAMESYFSLMMNALTTSQQWLFGAWSMWMRGQAPHGAGVLSASALAKSTNDALRPYQRRARANARRLKAPRAAR